MSKVGSTGAANAGPTAAAAAAAAQKQKTLLQRVDADVAQIVDNFGLLINVARVHAADSLLKLLSELKQTAIFSSFASLNDQVERRIAEFEQQAEKTDRLLEKIGEQAAGSLKELEAHYYSSLCRTGQQEE